MLDAWGMLQGMDVNDHGFRETCHSVTSHCTGQFTPKMKANAEPCLLSSLVRIDFHGFHEKCVIR